jgi:hypothetical protein
LSFRVLKNRIPFISKKNNPVRLIINGNSILLKFS